MRVGAYLGREWRGMASLGAWSGSGGWWNLSAGKPEVSHRSGSMILQILGPYGEMGIAPIRAAGTVHPSPRRKGCGEVAPLLPLPRCRVEPRGKATGSSGLTASGCPGLSWVIPGYPGRGRAELFLFRLRRPRAAADGTEGFPGTGGCSARCLRVPLPALGGLEVLSPVPTLPHLLPTCLASQPIPRDTPKGTVLLLWLLQGKLDLAWAGSCLSVLREMLLLALGC